MIDFSNITDPFMATWPVALIAVLYAAIRAKHDSYVNQGKWKTWAFVEGGFWAITTGLLLGQNLLDYFMLPVIFALWFSLFFDPFCGLFRVGKFFYIGDTDKVDKKVKKVFVNGRNYFIFKFVWLIIVSGVYESFLIWS